MDGLAENKSQKRAPIRKNADKGKVKQEGKNLMWNLDMDRAIADILRDERSRGRKGDLQWKGVAYNTAASILSAQFDVGVTAENIKNRVKSWKKYYGIVSDILSQSGFSWDSSSHMISVDENSVWEEYVKSHADAVNFRYKRIPNWENIVDLCGKDRATGNGAETSVEAIEFMTPPSNDVHHIDVDSNDIGFEDVHIIEDISPTHASSQKRKNQATPSSNIPAQKKAKSTKDVIGSSVDRMASSFEELIRATTQTLSPKEVWTEVMAISDLTTEERIKASVWLIENNKQFLILKEVPMEMKKSMVMMFISYGSA